MADISRVQPTPGIQQVQNQAYKVQGSNGAEDQRRRRHEEHEQSNEKNERSHDKLELHSEETDVPKRTPKPVFPEDHGLDIAI